MSGVWEAAVERQIRWHKTKVKLQGNQISTRMAAVTDAVKKLEQAEGEMLKMLKRHDDDLQKLLERRNDPEVIVRNYNKSTLYTFHASAACGWAPATGNSEHILLSVARERGYGPCTSCGGQLRKKTAVTLS